MQNAQSHLGRVNVVSDDNQLGQLAGFRMPTTRFCRSRSGVLPQRLRCSREEQFRRCNASGSWVYVRRERLVQRWGHSAVPTRFVTASVIHGSRLPDVRSVQRAC